MLETQIPKDVRKYESKLIGPLTSRQTLFAVIAFICAFCGYRVASHFTDSTTAFTVALICCVPAICFGWPKPYGMPMEQFLMSILFSMFLTPRKRKYKIENRFRMVETPLKPMSEKEYKKRCKKDRKMAKKDPRYIAYR